MREKLPILDAHIHLDPKGAPKDAVKRFLSKGGTHLIIIHKPYHHIENLNIEGYIKSFETTVEMCRLSNDLGCRSWCFLGPYPGELPFLAERIGLKEAVDLQKRALDIAYEFVKEGKALGIGEVGRIHFPVNEGLQEICDDILLRAFEGAKTNDCPVVLHTESFYSNPHLMLHLSSLIDRTGLRREKVIKHYSGPDLIPPGNNQGISLSLQCRRETLKMLLSSDFDHLLETDYIDDPRRPNVVMPPDTVPKKIEWAYSQGIIDPARHARLMIDLPKRIMDIETNI
jgi:TatD-related deoxyribonuclease